MTVYILSLVFGPSCPIKLSMFHVISAIVAPDSCVPTLCSRSELANITCCPMSSCGAYGLAVVLRVLYASCLAGSSPVTAPEPHACAPTAYSRCIAANCSAPLIFTGSTPPGCLNSFPVFPYNGHLRCMCPPPHFKQGRRKSE